MVDATEFQEAPDSQEVLIPIEALARKLTVSVSTIRAWVRQGHIPSHTYIKVGPTYRFSPSRVVEALFAKPKNDLTLAEPDDGPVQLELDFDTPNPDQDA